MHLCLCLLLTPRTFLFHPNPVPVMHSAPVADTTASAASNTSSVAYCDDKGQVLLLVLSLVCCFLNREVLLGWYIILLPISRKNNSKLVASENGNCYAVFIFSFFFFKNHSPVSVVRHAARYFLQNWFHPWLFFLCMYKFLAKLSYLLNYKKYCYTKCTFKFRKNKINQLKTFFSSYNSLFSHQNETVKWLIRYRESFMFHTFKKS